MNWLMNLYETYESNKDMVGKIEKDRYDKTYTLLPISHTTQQAHIEVNITKDGDFHSASVIDKNEANTLIPCTESSASRAGSKIAPYPLHDKLSYVAGDFKLYGGIIKKEEPFYYYIDQLGNWANSRYANTKVVSIYNYLKKRQLIQDLVEANILFLDSHGELIDKWDKQYEQLYDEKPKIFSVTTNSQQSAFIRFNVYSEDTLLQKTWDDKEVYDSFINFYNDLLQEDDLCFVTGESQPYTERHANKIRNPADKAKLISANDTSGFTFRGRFEKGKQVASISYEVSQKAHNALKWLIRRQARQIDQRVFLVWGNDNLDLPDPTEDAYTLNPNPLNNLSSAGYTDKEFAGEVAKALDGYKSDLNYHADVNILILDSATTGRLAVLYYRNLDQDFYLDRLKYWHRTCAWLHRYRRSPEYDNKFVHFYGAPALKDIAYVAHGSKANEKLIKELMTRLLPCVVDRRNIPRDIVRNVFYRASNPVGMEKWEWEKTLSIACALINKQEEGYEVALNVENHDRDYLFGRLLAIADVLERQALGREETRATNAIRYMNAFSKHPERTWKTLQESLQPYQARLGVRATYLSSLIDDVASKFDIDEFDNKPLSGKYLLGFYSQRHELYRKKQKDTSEQENN